MENKTCCIFGNRTIKETDNLKMELTKIIERLITHERVSVFLFGSKSHFDSICLELVTKIKEKYPHIKRVYVRAEYPNITNEYKEHLLKSFDETYFPERIVNSGKAVYVERNQEMINKSQFCLVYYDKEMIPKNRKSGTKIALGYAIKSGKKIIFLPENIDYKNVADWKS